MMHHVITMSGCVGRCGFRHTFNKINRRLLSVPAAVLYFSLSSKASSVPMAEAHQAVAFQFSVSDDGVLFHVQLKPLALALWRLARSRCQGIRNTILKGIFPATPLSLLFVSAGVATLHATGIHPSIDTIYFGPRYVYNSFLTPLEYKDIV